MENDMTDFTPAHRKSDTENTAKNNPESIPESKPENHKGSRKKNTTIYLVRHGTTEWNQQLRYQGRADNPLDEAGESQGSLLEEYFADIDVDLAVTSPLQRAKKTLEYCLAAQKHPVPVLVDPSVIEFDFGDADGMTKEQLRQTYPEFYRMYVLNEDRGHSAAPGGESLAQVYCRMRDSILRIAREHQGSTIVIASHGTAIQTFLNFASGIPWQEMKHFLLYNVSVSCVEIEPDGSPHVIFIGDRSHIPEDLAFCYAKQGK